MNTERIRELAEQAEVWNVEGDSDKCEVDLEKFAKLIVKECLGDFKDRIARRYQGSVRDRDVAYGMEIVCSNIQDKFGVDDAVDS